jgi:Replication-relaxation
VRPSRRVAASAPANTFPYIICGNETKQNEGAKVTGVSAQLNVSARGVARLRDRLSERDRAILRQVGELRLMSARQIQAIHFPSERHDNELAATRARQRVLTRLCRERLLSPLQRRVGGVRAGSAGLVLALGPIGQRVLTANGPRRRSYEPTLRFFDHTLAASQLAVELNVAARAGVLELLSWEAEPQSWREFSWLGGRRVLRPDAFVSLGSSGYELRWFCEIDRSTESVPTVLRKCQLYADYYQSGQEQAAHGGVFPRVCWIVPDETRAERLRAAIERERRLPARLFVVTTSERAVTTLAHTQVTVNT